MPGAGLVAVDPLRVRRRHRPEPRVCAAVAAVRRVLRLRLPQVRPLRGGAAGAARRPRADRDPRRAAARAPRRRGTAGRRRGSPTAPVQRLSGGAGPRRSPRRKDPRPRRAEQDHRMSSSDAPAGAAPVDKIRTALTGYRALAWATGIWLIALCYEMVLKYLVKVDDPPVWIGVVHGWVYFAYLLATLNLATKVRWGYGKTLGILLSGTIPLLGIIVEHFQTRSVKAQFGV